MATGWEMLPETAKALSAPVTKLIEVVAAGCGKFYGPTDITRTATAQGEAMVILEAAKLRANEVAMRAANRILEVEIRRQKNIEAICQIAQSELPSKVAEEPVDKDWSARFFREAQDVSSEQMQLLWGKLLAGEVAKPGSFSQRTLSVASSLSQIEAGKFTALCSLLSKVSGELIGFIQTNLASVEKVGIEYKDLLELQAAGLIIFEPSGQHLAFLSTPDNGAKIYIERPGDVLLIATHPLKKTMSIGVVSVTATGQELFNIAGWAPTPEHDKSIFNELVKEGWVVERAQIIEKLSEDEFKYHSSPFEDHASLLDMPPGGLSPLEP